MPAGGEERAPVADDPWDALLDANTAPRSVGDDDGTGRITLELALLHCETSGLTGAWTFAPGRWDTADGCVPVRVVWATFAMLSAPRARNVIDTVRGIGLAFGGEKSADAFEQIQRDAFPTVRDPTPESGGDP